MRVCAICERVIENGCSSVDECDCGAELPICSSCSGMPEEGDTPPLRGPATDEELDEARNRWGHHCDQPGLYADEFRARHTIRTALQKLVVARSSYDVGNDEQTKSQLQQAIAALSTEYRIKSF